LFLDTVLKEGFLKDVHRNMLITENDPKTLLANMVSYVAPLLAESGFLGRFESSESPMHLDRFWIRSTAESRIAGRHVAVALQWPAPS
jgi:hypothetical protein